MAGNETLVQNEDNKTYWGWNKVPASTSIVSKPENVDALIFALPCDYDNVENLLKDTGKRDIILSKMNQQITYYKNHHGYRNKPVLFTNSVRQDPNDISRGYQQLVFVEDNPLYLDNYTIKDGWAYPK